MSASCERRGGKQRRLVGEREERFDVAAPGIRDEHGQLVHHLFARGLDARDEEPDGRMEPEDRADHFLSEDPHPVAPPHVPQFVREYRPLHDLWQGPQRFRKEHDGMADAERHRLTDHLDVPDLGAGLDEPGDFVVLIARCSGLAGFPEPAQAEDACAEPGESQHRTGDERDARQRRPRDAWRSGYCSSSLRDRRRAGNRARLPCRKNTQRLIGLERPWRGFPRLQDRKSDTHGEHDSPARVANRRRLDAKHSQQQRRDRADQRNLARPGKQVREEGRIDHSSISSMTRRI